MFYCYVYSGILFLVTKTGRKHKRKRKRKMKNVAALNLGFSDAQNYTQRGNKQMLSSVFVRNSYLDDLLKPNIYFLIGEKGTGKTAYAAFLNNNEYNNNTNN